MRTSEREMIARRALGYGDADQTEVLVGSSDDALTRFTHENVHQNVASSDISISVRAIIDGRTGAASTNRTDEASLAETVARATEMARLAPRDPAQPQLPGHATTSTPPGAYDDATAEAGAEERASICATYFKIAETHGLWCAGYARTGSHGYTIGNSNGAFSSYDGTYAGTNVKMSGTDSTGFAEACATGIAGIDAAAVGDRAARKAIDTAKPRGVAPGLWTVILEPAAFAELLAFLSSHFSAQAYDEGSSFCSGALGEQLLGTNVTIHDDYAHPLVLDAPFDYEGAPTQRLALVENGIVRNVVTDSYWAHRLDKPNTGHALPAPNAWGPEARAIVVTPGDKSAEELIEQTERGLLISRLWYVRTVDQRRAIVTGMTRDGTYLIENGKRAGGVRNLRFNESIVDALGRCEFALDLHRSTTDNYSIVTPAVKIENFTFSSTTEF